MTRTVPQDAYEILGVLPTDDFATIRKAWLQQVRRHHPDLNPNDVAAATARLAALNDAYDALVWHKKMSDEEFATQKARDRRRAEAERRAEKARREAEARAAETRAAARRAEAARARRAEMVRRARDETDPAPKPRVAIHFDAAREIFDMRAPKTLRCA